MAPAVNPSCASTTASSQNDAGPATDVTENGGPVQPTNEATLKGKGRWKGKGKQQETEAETETEKDFDLSASELPPQGLPLGPARPFSDFKYLWNNDRNDVVENNETRQPTASLPWAPVSFAISATDGPSRYPSIADNTPRERLIQLFLDPEDNNEHGTPEVVAESAPVIEETEYGITGRSRSDPSVLFADTIPSAIVPPSARYPSTDLPGNGFLNNLPITPRDDGSIFPIVPENTSAASSASFSSLAYSSFILPPPLAIASLPPGFITVIPPPPPPAPLDPSSSSSSSPSSASPSSSTAASSQTSSVPPLLHAYLSQMKEEREERIRQHALGDAWRAQYAPDVVRRFEETVFAKRAEEGDWKTKSWHMSAEYHGYGGGRGGLGGGVVTGGARRGGGGGGSGSGAAAFAAGALDAGVLDAAGVLNTGGAGGADSASSLDGAAIAVGAGVSDSSSHGGAATDSGVAETTDASGTAGAADTAGAAHASTVSADAASGSSGHGDAATDAATGSSSHDGAATDATTRSSSHNEPSA